MKKSLMICCLTVLTACSAARYQEYNLGSGGYKTTDIAGNEFTIYFKPGLFTKEDLSLSNKYAMRRAAEKTLENGYTHFTCEPWSEGLRVRCYPCHIAPYHAYDAGNILRFQSS